MKVETLYKCEDLFDGAYYYSAFPLYPVGVYLLDTETMLCEWLGKPSEVKKFTRLIDYNAFDNKSRFWFSFVKAADAQTDCGVVIGLEDKVFNVGWVFKSNCTNSSMHDLVQLFLNDVHLCDTVLERETVFRIVLICASIPGVYHVVLEGQLLFFNLWFDVIEGVLLCYAWGFPCVDLQEMSGLSEASKQRYYLLKGKIAMSFLLDGGRLY